MIPGMAMTPRRRLRVIQGSAVAVAVLLHVVFFTALAPQARLRPMTSAASPSQTFEVTLVRPDRPVLPPAQPARLPERRQPQETRPAAATDRPFSRPLSQASPDWRVQPVTPPGPGTPVVGGIRLDSSSRITVPPETRAVLRSSVGCDYDGPLSQAEQDACNERMAANRNAPALGLTADRARDRQLDTDARRKTAVREYREAAPPVGTFDDLRDMARGDGPRE